MLLYGNPHHASFQETKLATTLPKKKCKIRQFSEVSYLFAEMNGKNEQIQESDVARDLEEDTMVQWPK